MRTSLTLPGIALGQPALKGARENETGKGHRKLGTDLNGWPQAGPFRRLSGGSVEKS